MSCVKTGCTATLNGNFVGGDLHLIGNCFVFNAIYDYHMAQVKASWTDDPTMFTHYSCQVDFSYSNNLVEKWALLVAPVNECVINQELMDYLDMYGPSVVLYHYNYNRTI